jgi:hypothetical protein
VTGITTCAHTSGRTRHNLIVVCWRRSLAILD